MSFVQTKGMPVFFDNSANFLFGAIGNRVYPFIATALFVIFPYMGDMSHAMIFMSITGALLLMFNVYGIIRLSDKIKFSNYK